MIIKEYQDFIIKENIKLILEGELCASGDFLLRIGNIKKNKIAKVVYDLFDYEPYIDKNLTQNYIDVCGEDEVTFISDTRLDRLYDTEEDDVNPYTAKGRGTIKIGRFISALLKNNLIKDELPSDFKFNDKDIEEFVNLYKSSDLNSLKQFKLVSGDNISKWYDEDKYANQKGTLGGSCMKDVKSSFFEIYTQNNKVCRLLILVDKNNKLLGRALVWKLYESPCEAEYFMDRVYVSNDSDVNRFINYAKENKWLYKYKMSADLKESVLFYYNEIPTIGKIVVKLKESVFLKYPFLDTLCFLNSKEKTLSNVGAKGDYVLGSTSGDKERCSECGGDGKYDCYSCDDGKVTCSECSGEGYIECDECNATGKIGKKTCKSCEDGYIECEECEGKGKFTCSDCNGDTSCPECVGVLSDAIKTIKAGHFKEFKNYLPK
jgi:hypothetical protein